MRSLTRTRKTEAKEDGDDRDFVPEKSASTRTRESRRRTTRTAEAKEDDSGSAEVDAPLETEMYSQVHSSGSSENLAPAKGA